MNKEEFLIFQSRMDAMKEVIRINDPQKYEMLTKKDLYWAPEIRPLQYTKWVNENIEINPDSTLSLCVYSLLMNMPIEELKEKMIADLNNRSKK